MNIQKFCFQILSAFVLWITHYVIHAIYKSSIPLDEPSFKAGVLVGTVSLGVAIVTYMICCAIAEG